MIVIKLPNKWKVINKYNLDERKKMSINPQRVKDAGTKMWLKVEITNMDNTNKPKYRDNSYCEYKLSSQVKQ